MKVIRSLLDSAIDYAGLFPPAGLGMEEAVWNYAGYTTHEHSWALGRFVVPASRIGELHGQVSSLKPGYASPWHLSVLLGSDLESDRVEIENAGSTVLIDSVEVKWTSSLPIDRVSALFGNRTVYLELPVDAPQALVHAIARRRLRAKVRTGGLTGDLFPSTEALARFLVCCADQHIPFKATAGLHHALRSVHALTYDPFSASEKMHGFLNLLLGSAAAYAGCGEEQVNRALQEELSDSFEFFETEIRWRDMVFAAGFLRKMRDRFFSSFGSCSFEEPLSELDALGLL